jgi:hypothetical protein
MDEDETEPKEEGRNGKENETINEKWQKTKYIYNDVAKSVLGVRKLTDKPWISEETWEKIDERKEIRNKIVVCVTIILLYCLCTTIIYIVWLSCC